MICPECDGTGICRICRGDNFVTCSSCRGEGILSIALQSGEIKRSRCPFCSGRGQVTCSPVCKTCDGYGHISQGDLDRETLPQKYREYREFVSWEILLINLLAFIAGALSLLLFHRDYLLELFACNGTKIMQGEVWRLFTSLFLHIGYNHFLVNSYALLLICPMIEKTIGKSKFLGIYLASGLLGNILTILLKPEVWSAGASGALYGILGTYMGLQNRYRVFKSSLFVKICLLVVVDTVIALIPGARINLLAHLGGLVGGFILSSFIRLEENNH